MQALRTAARRLADAVHLLDYKKSTDSPQTDQSREENALQLQYIWLLEHCGHFARSFASDELWRDRGHASGDDVIFVLRDVEAAFLDALEGIESEQPRLSDGIVYTHFWDVVNSDDLFKKSKERVGLHSLSGIVAPGGMEKHRATEAAIAAEGALSKERLLVRERRKVLVASCITYNRAILAFRDLMNLEKVGSLSKSDPTDSSATEQSPVLNLLLQRFGDACNETGKILLAALQTLLSDSHGGKKASDSQLAADALLASAQFWFSESLDAFGACGDVRNLALVRCNICQSYKLRANAGFEKQDTTTTQSSSTHAEDCYQEAANQLLKAHEDIGQRDIDPRTWDMVSEQLAATFLLLGFRRRQSLLGAGNTPVILQMMRLSPGEERSIVDPMERALKIYEQLGNEYQAAAAHYQLALTFSKMWTCQLNESNTRKKLSQAFQHYAAAFGYFSTHIRGNEPTFCVLCLDLASLYDTIPGEEVLVKALGCCLDCSGAFSVESAKAASAMSDSAARNVWYEKMETIAESVDERVFKLLRSLVKVNQERYKDLYREGLTAKMVRNVPEDNEVDGNPQAAKLFALHQVLESIKRRYESVVSNQSNA
jgi:hypothetical protein